MKIPEIKELAFTILACIIIIIVIVIPTGFSPDTTGTVRVKAEIIQVDNSSVSQFGMVKTGEQRLKVKILNRAYKGRKVTAVNHLMGKMELDKMFKNGDTVLAVCTIEDRDIIHTNVVDHYRIHVEIFLFILFFILLVLFGKFIGFKAFISFVFAIIMIWKILLPLFLKGYSPIPVSLAITMIITATIIFLVAGISKKGLCAFLGASSGIFLTCGLAMLFGKLFRIHGAVKPFSETLLYSGFGHLDLSSIFLAGIFIASSGAVMDLSMDIAASMQEIAGKNPDIKLKELIQSGFNVGRAVVGTMTTTLLLAYTGSYATMLLVFIGQRTPLINIMNINYVASEILHTLVGSFGLVSVAPLTAIISGFVLSKRENWDIFKHPPHKDQFSPK